jgi:hypothetical protein
VPRSGANSPEIRLKAVVLPGAIRADQRVQRPVAQPKRHVLDRVDAAEMLGQP